MRRIWSKLAITLALPGLLLQPTAAAPPAGGTGEAALANRPNEVRGDEITPQQREAVAKGLKWLASRQSAKGAWGMGGMSTGAVQESQGHAGISALCGLAFMSAGNLPNRGEYGTNVQKCLKFVLDCTQDSGLITSDQSNGVMYGHGFATLFLAEVYGMSPDDQVKEKLQRAVRLIERSQNTEGGWRYQPWPYDADISVTICEVMALRAARDAGIRVDKDVIDKAIKYVKSCQNKPPGGDGGFNYQAQGGGSGFARTAAGVASLYYLSSFDDKAIENGLAYLKNYKPGGAQSFMDRNYYFYGNYYATQAMFLAGGDLWAQWYPAIRDQLIKSQNPQQGSWDSPNEGGGADYATAMALIILQMPNRYLPVFHGKGPGS